MKFRIIASVIVLAVIIIALFLKAGGNNADSQEGAPAATEQTQ